MTAMNEPATLARPHAPACQDLVLLPIPPGGAATTVYISIASDGTTLKPAFSLTPTGPTFPDGMTWTVDAEFGLFLNFVFMFSQLGTILAIDVDPPMPGLWYSKAMLSPPPTGINQQCCTQNVVGCYEFHVDIRTHHGDTIRVDPKIVVTPQHI